MSAYVEGLEYLQVYESDLEGQTAIDVLIGVGNAVGTTVRFEGWLDTDTGAAVTIAAIRPYPPQPEGQDA